MASATLLIFCVEHMSGTASIPLARSRSSTLLRLMVCGSTTPSGSWNNQTRVKRTHAKPNPFGNFEDAKKHTCLYCTHRSIDQSRSATQENMMNALTDQRATLLLMPMSRTFNLAHFESMGFPPDSEIETKQATMWALKHVRDRDEPRPEKRCQLRTPCNMRHVYWPARISPQRYPRP